MTMIEAMFKLYGYVTNKLPKNIGMRNKQHSGKKKTMSYSNLNSFSFVSFFFIFK